MVFVKEEEMRRFLIARSIAVFALAASFVAAASAADAPPYTINVILPLTGPAAFVGQTDQKSLQTLQGLTNKEGGIRGRPLAFVFADDGSNPQTTVQLATQILAAKPAVVLGSAPAGSCAAVAPLFQAAKTVAWCFSPTFYPPVGGYVYPSQTGSKDLMRIQVKYMRTHGIKRLALLSTTDVSGKTGESELNEIMKEPESSGVALVADEVFGPSDVGVGAQLAKIKAAQPDALMIWTAGAPLGTALTGVRDTGLDTLPIFAASSSMVYTQMLGLAPVLPKTIYFVGYGFNSDKGKNDVATRKLKAFDDAVTAAGMHIDGVTGMAWDGAAIVIDALRAVGPDATGEQLRSWIASQKNYAGISGIYNLNQKTDMHGLGIDDLLIVRWNAQKQTWVPASKFGGSPL
jgi:branched-chain amino acid transport system substrate-binding protein